MDGVNLAAITSVVLFRGVISEIECKLNTRVEKGVRIAREIIGVRTLSGRDDGGSYHHKRSLEFRLFNRQMPLLFPLIESKGKQRVI